MNGSVEQDGLDVSGSPGSGVHDGTGQRSGANQINHILLIDDSPGDVRLTTEAFREAGTPVHLSVVSNGVDAMAFLHRLGRFRDVPRPDLILLDLNLPCIHGREVLAGIKMDSSLDAIPVIVLTISNAEEDIITSYNLHANCFVTKPVNLDQFFQVIRSIGRFWLRGPVSSIGEVTHGS